MKTTVSRARSPTRQQSASMFAFTCSASQTAWKSGDNRGEHAHFAHMRKSSARNRCRSRWWCIPLHFYLLHHCLSSARYSLSVVASAIHPIQSFSISMAGSLFCCLVSLVCLFSSVCVACNALLERVSYFAHSTSVFLFCTAPPYPPHAPPRPTSANTFLPLLKRRPTHYDYTVTYAQGPERGIGYCWWRARAVQLIGASAVEHANVFTIATPPQAQGHTISAGHRK